MAETYGAHERAALFVLALADREIPNPELVHDFGIKLSPAGRAKLVQARLLETRRDGNRIVHRITTDGIAWCRRELAAVEPPARSGPLVRAVFEVVRRLCRGDLRLADLAGPVEPADLESLIRTAYRELSQMPEDWVRLARLRPKLDGADRSEVDRTLVAMVKGGGVHLVPDSNRKALTREDHAAAIRVGSEDKHLMAIEGS